MPVAFLFSIAYLGPPRAVTFGAELLAPRPAAEATLRALRAGGVSHLAAVSGGDGEGAAAAALVACGALDGVVPCTPSGEPAAPPEVLRAAAIEQWVHVCSTVPQLAAAKRAGARTVWLNERAAGDENSRGFDGPAGEASSYLARGVIADLVRAPSPRASEATSPCLASAVVRCQAGAVCARLDEVEAALQRAQQRHEAEVAQRKGAGGDDDAADALARLRGSLPGARAAGDGAGSDGAGAASGPTDWDAVLAAPGDAGDAGDADLRGECPSCGARLAPAARFCSECGHSTVVQTVRL